MKAKELADILMKWPEGEVVVFDTGVDDDCEILWVDKDSSDGDGECTVIIAVR